MSESHVVLLLEGGTLRRVRYSEEQLKEKKLVPLDPHVLSELVELCLYNA